MEPRMEGLCREAYPLPTNPADYVEFGDEIEEWEAVKARAISVAFVQPFAREPWSSVYRVRFEDGPKFYLVAG